MEVKRPKVKQNLVDKKINSSYLEEGALVLHNKKVNGKFHFFV